MTDFTPVAEAFSRKAKVYDAFGQDHPNLARMRARVRQHLMRLRPPPARLLELNAGTGADAVYFAQQGYRVLATDISPGMVAEIRAKIEKRESRLEIRESRLEIRESGIGDRLSVQQLSFTDLDRLDDGPFDVVFSNMGGLNCIPDLAAVTRHLPGLLAPGGVVTFVIMPPICPWEWTAVLRGDFRTAFRRLKPGGVLANVEGVRFRTWYFTPRQARRAFGPGFRTARLEALSLFTPPADRKHFAHRFPRLYRALAWLDDRLAPRFPFNHWGDFFVLSMRFEGVE